MNLKLKLILMVLSLVIVAVPLGVYSESTNNSTVNNSIVNITNSQNLSHNNTTILKVPDLLAPTANSTGPTALQEVLAYYGTNIGIDKLVNLTNNTENGTFPNNIVQAADSLGFQGELKENMSLEDLQNYVDQGIPVIVNIQAGINGTENFNWTSSQQNGEYMVIVGVDSQNVYLEDPTILGSVGYIPNQEFLDRWHATFQTGTNSTNSSTNATNTTNSTNSTNSTNFNTLFYNHMGIIVTGGSSTSTPLFVKLN
jgi:uncharacterized protein